MCVAIYKPAGRHVSRKDLAACFARNPDGAGFMYQSKKEDGTPYVHVEKGFFDFKTFFDAYKDHVFGKAADKAIAIHFRIGTSGLKDVNNCHPHILADDFAFIHNGILSSYAKAKSDFSDTHHFMNEVLKPFYDRLGMNFLDVGEMPTLLCEHMGVTNKMVMMPANGTVWIMHKRMGVERNNIWFSNTNWDVGASTQSYNYGNYNGGKWSARGRELLSATHGCWIDNQYYQWWEYDKLYPLKDGPFEAYLKANELMGRTKDKAPEEKPPETCVTCEDLGTMPEPTTATEGNIAPVLDDPPKDNQEPETKESKDDLYPESRCFVCKDELTPDEVRADEGLCAGCLIDVTQAFNPSNLAG